MILGSDIEKKFEFSAWEGSKVFLVHSEILKIQQRTRLTKQAKVIK
jgi:hypothetical protein